MAIQADYPQPQWYLVHEFSKRCFPNRTHTRLSTMMSVEEQLGCCCG